MIRAVLYRNAENQYTGYSAKGHSDYAEEGFDIVCAAVSVLGATCANSLESVCGIIPDIIENDSGALHFALPSSLSKEAMHDAQILFGALHQGLKDVEEQFPEDVQLSIMIGGKSHD